MSSGPFRAAEAEEHVGPLRPPLRAEGGGAEPLVRASRHPDQPADLPVLPAELQLRAVREVRLQQVALSSRRRQD